MQRQRAHELEMQSLFLNKRTHISYQKPQKINFKDFKSLIFDFTSQISYQPKKSVDKERENDQYIFRLNSTVNSVGVFIFHKRRRFTADCVNFIFLDEVSKFGT